MRGFAVAVATIVVACSLGAAASATPAPIGFTVAGTAPSGGTLLQGTFPSRTAPRPLRPGFVYLPPGFSPASRYPVVYLLHGMPGDPREYVAPLDIAAVADGLIASGRTRPFIAVMPAAGPTVHYNGEWAGPWERYLVDDVVPWIDAHLPTIATGTGRTIAGLSAGGYGAADIGLRAPRMFGTIESWSGYFHPLHDGPFKHASPADLAANDPALLAAEQRRPSAPSGRASSWAAGRATATGSRSRRASTSPESCNASTCRTPSCSRPTTLTSTASSSPPVSFGRFGPDAQAGERRCRSASRSQSPACADQTALSCPPG